MAREGDIEGGDVVHDDRDRFLTGLEEFGSTPFPVALCGIGQDRSRRVALTKGIPHALQTLKIHDSSTILFERHCAALCQ